jgi:hypothetical protein
MTGFWDNFKQAVPMFSNNPGFTCFAVAALALGINSAILTVVDAVLLKLLTYPGADRRRAMRLKRHVDDFYGERRNGVGPGAAGNGHGRLYGVYLFWGVDRVGCCKRCAMQRCHGGGSCSSNSGQAQ